METDKRISRREALTRMGMIVAGAAASSIGLPALTSCTESLKRNASFCISLPRETVCTLPAN